MTSRAALIVLTADDYAMTAGVSTGIRQLAEALRLSATSVMTTTRHWPEEAKRIARLRDRIAVGVHLDLTLGTPLGPIASLAPQGKLPDVGALTKLALLGRIDRGEVAAEFGRQLARFEDALGHPPDHIDGHQHVHALPGVREALIEALARRAYANPPLIRVPTDTPGAILSRGRATTKALTLAALARGFRAAVVGAGYPVNDTFAGVSGFAADGVAADFRAGRAHAGPLHILMCHPGLVDDELVRLDPVTDRREAELQTLMADDALAGLIWRPQRAADGAAVDWSGVRGAVC